MKNSDFRMRPTPVTCGNCRERRNLTITVERKRIRLAGGMTDHVKVICRRCEHVWWSRHPDALKDGAA